MAAGLLSSFGEIEHAVASPAVQRYPLKLQWVINQSFAIDHYQPLLFVVESFEHLYDLVGTLEQWMIEGKLNAARRANRWCVRKISGAFKVKRRATSQRSLPFRTSLCRLAASAGEQSSPLVG